MSEKRGLKLVIFDADGTLIDRDKKGSPASLLPGVIDRLLHITDANPSVSFAIATNQGGPACHDAGWSWSDKFPSLVEVNARYTILANEIGAKLYMCLAYRVKSNGRMIFPKGVSDNDPRINSEWRKPKPGMLIQAMEYFNATPDETLFIGDREDDKLAAGAAGCHFQWAQWGGGLV